MEWRERKDRRERACDCGAVRGRSAGGSGIRVGRLLTTHSPTHSPTLTGPPTPRPPQRSLNADEVQDESWLSSSFIDLILSRFAR